MMSSSADNVPNRAYEIIDALSGGVTREDIAEQYGHADRQAIDQFMRRHGFTWDKALQNYVPRGSSMPNNGRISSSRVIDVVAQFRKHGADAKEIAKRLRFTNHHEMAKYMQARGYTWDPQESNYVSVHGGDEDGQLTAEPLTTGVTPTTEPITKDHSFSPSVDWGKFVPLLSRLLHNEDKLMSILERTVGESSIMPRYVIPGVYTVKSIHMVAGLDQLVKDFSRERNITQREIFEVALVHFFKRYGFEREIDALMVH